MRTQLAIVYGDVNGPTIQWNGEDVIAVRSASLIRFGGNIPDGTLVRIYDLWGQSVNNPSSIVYAPDGTDLPITQLDQNRQVIELLFIGGSFQVLRKEAP